MIVRTATSKDDYQQVAALMRAFVEWHGERHAADRHIVESYFDPVAFSEELDNLPGKFAEPGEGCWSRKRTAKSLAVLPFAISATAHAR